MIKSFIKKTALIFTLIICLLGTASITSSAFVYTFFSYPFYYSTTATSGFVTSQTLSRSATGNSYAQATVDNFTGSGTLTIRCISNPFKSNIKFTGNSGAKKGYFKSVPSKNANVTYGGGITTSSSISTRAGVY